MTSVAVVGLGRVGLPLALSFADRGLDVIGVEREPAVLDQVAAGRMPFRETGTQVFRPQSSMGQRPSLADTAVIGPAPAGIEAAVYLEELAHPKACSDKGQNDRCPDNPFPH